jgi:hypothetical protein
MILFISPNSFLGVGKHHGFRKKILETRGDGSKLFLVLGLLMNGAAVSSRAIPEPNIYRLQTLALPCVCICACSLSLLSYDGG